VVASVDSKKATPEVVSAGESADVNVVVIEPSTRRVIPSYPYPNAYSGVTLI